MPPITRAVIKTATAILGEFFMATIIDRRHEVGLRPV
jgi:hypothetical protein